MDWLKQWNDALGYLENSLTEKADYEQAAKLAGCSSYHFQRMFPYLTGVPLSEYLRRRRMTAAAFDLQNGEKVLEVALRYGYESPTSFNRAFQAVHGVTPSAAQKQGALLKAYPKISFQITIKGEVEMEFRIEKKEAFRIVGISAPLDKEIEKNFDVVPKLWEKAAETGAVELLASQMMDSQPMGVLGVSACANQDDAWNYYISVSSSKPITEELKKKGVEEYTVPACTWAIFPGKGAMPVAIQDIEKRAVTEWMPSSGYEYAEGPDIEVYLEPNPMDAKFEVWVPVRKKEN